MVTQSGELSTTAPGQVKMPGHSSYKDADYWNKRYEEEEGEQSAV
jgi:hypothetical protein